MKIQVELDASCKEPEVLIRTCEMTDEISVLMQKLSASNQTILAVLAGFTEECVQLLDMADIVRIYASDKKVFAETEAQEFLVRMRLYELEARLDKTQFVRISNSEIVNLKSIQRIDLSFAGTIGITFTNGKTSYVSRRYVSKIKRVLGM